MNKFLQLFVKLLTLVVKQGNGIENFVKNYRQKNVILSRCITYFSYLQDYRHNAEAAKAALDGSQHKGRTLRVRFSNQGSAIKIKNLSPFVSNELLEMAMQQFGDVERAVVVVDDRGRSTGEGIVEFARKPGAQQALKRINDGVFLMTSYVEIKQRYM